MIQWEDDMHHSRHLAEEKMSNPKAVIGTIVLQGLGENGRYFVTPIFVESL